MLEELLVLEYTLRLLLHILHLSLHNPVQVSVVDASLPIRRLEQKVKHAFLLAHVPHHQSLRPLHHPDLDLLLHQVHLHVRIQLLQCFQLESLDWLGVVLVVPS
jgi:hypothetical protein